MEKVFLVPGLGADKRLFRNLNLSGYDVTCINWLEPGKGDTLATYAAKLVDAFKIGPQSSVIGVSLGGMLAVEIAKQVALKHVIIISSIKSSNEAPAFYKFFRAFPVYKLIPSSLMVRMGSIFKPFFFKRVGNEGRMFNMMLRNTSPKFLKWAMHAALHWDSMPLIRPVNHIIGDADLIFNYRKIKDATVVKGGDHMMVFVKAREISKLIRAIID